MPPIIKSDPMEELAFRLMVTGGGSVVRDGSLNIALIDLIEEIFRESNSDDQAWQNLGTHTQKVHAILTTLLGLRRCGAEYETAISALLDALRSPGNNPPFEILEMPPIPPELLS